LSSSITKVNKNSRLFLIREAPQTLFPRLLKSWKITHLVFEKDTDAYGRQRDAEILAIAQKAGVKVITKSGRTLWDSDEIVKKNGGPTMSITQLQNAGKKIGQIPRPIATPKSLPDPGDAGLDFEHIRPDPNPDMNAIHRDGPDELLDNPKLSGPNGDFAVPTLEELGLKPATTSHKGGETMALKTLNSVISDKDYTATFAKPNTAPTAFEPQATTLLSPHLHFGSLSIREFYWRVQDIVSSYKGQATSPPTSLIGQLLFRDMYFGAQAALGHEMQQSFNNPTCRVIPWHLPSIYDPSTGLATGNYSIDSPEAETWFRRWKTGTTGFPWIDGLMRQLKTEGWIHHLGRHSVACFLTRGGCYIDWERGRDVFEEWLLDHEPSCNAGNWQWLSCTAFFAQYYRVYSPIAFPQKWDKEGKFIRKYVPELAKFDSKYIYEPWKAPISDQKKWGCLIKGDGTQKVESKLTLYPKPMFDFAERRKICLDGMKSAYDVGLKGGDNKVKDGSWRKLFSDHAEGPTKGKGGLGAMLDEMDKSNVDADTDGGYLDARSHGIKGEAVTKPAKAGTKRQASQSTLDGHLTKSKK
jgi:cryptochrome